MQTADGDFGESLAAANIKDPISGSRLQRVRQKLREEIVPPCLTQVLECG